VEAVVDRVTRRAIDPGRVLVLTFSRKAAAELRERITIRLDQTVRQPLAMTFHSYAYALVRREYALAGEPPPILLPGPEQLLEVRRLLRGEAVDGGHRWPERLRPALGTRGFAEELRDFLLRAAERGLDGSDLAALGRAHGRDDWVSAGRFLASYAARFDLAPVPAYDYAEIIRIAGALLRRGAVRVRERDAYDVVLVDEYQDTDPAQEELLGQLAGDGRELIAVDLCVPRRGRRRYPSFPGPLPRSWRRARRRRRAAHQSAQRPGPARCLPPGRREAAASGGPPGCRRQPGPPPAASARWRRARPGPDHHGGKRDPGSSGNR